jgi:hypothetical protein
MTDKPKRKHEHRTCVFEARHGDDPEYPIDVYSIVGPARHEYYENSYVDLEAARVDFPDIGMADAAPAFVKERTCPRCGNEDIEEGDGKNFVDEERRSFLCPRCNAGWYQWEQVTYAPYAIEMDGVTYGLPPPEAPAPPVDAVSLMTPSRRRPGQPGTFSTWIGPPSGSWTAAA